MGAVSTDDAGGAWPRALADIYSVRFVDFVRLAYLLTGHSGVAEEIAQDAFVAVAAKWSTVERPEAYLRAAVVNRCRSWFRRRDLEQRQEATDAVSCELEADELWDALGRLPYRRRAAIVLRFYEDLPDEEIAAFLGCRRGTVRTAIHRGLEQLRREIER